MLEVVSAQLEVSVYLSKCFRLFSHPHPFGDPFGGSRHQLHQTHRSRAGPCIGDESAFLADEPVYPGLIQLLLLHHITQCIPMRSEEAQAEVMIPHRLVGGMDGPVVNLVPARDFSRREKLAVIEIANRPTPFPRSLGAQVQAVESERPLNAW